MHAAQTDSPATPAATPSSTPEPPGATGLPVLRLLPAPASEPPYDDEVPASQVVLRTAPVRLVPAVSPLRLVHPGLQVATADDAGVAEDRGDVTGGWGDDAGEHRPRTPLAQLPAPRPFTHALVQRLLEVLAGVRPLGQLQRHTTPELFERLEQAVTAQPRCAGPRPDARAVRSVRVQTRADGVAEACATVRRQTPRGPRVHALALRLEGLDGRWCCTELLGL